MKKTIIYCFNVLLLLGVSFSAFSQVDVTATAGTTGPTTYTTLKLAFDAINAGTHQGDIVIGISANTTETAPAVLNSSGAGSAIYTSVLIQPTVDGITISGPTVAGRGLIEFNGSDNVTINGDNPNSSGINRNLTITNTAANTVSYTSAIRIATNTTGASSANNNSILNCNILGSAIGRNSSTTTSTTGSENTTFGIYVGGYGSTTSTGNPVAIASVTTNTTTGSCSANSTTISNNSVSQCARGIVFNGSATTFSTGVTITNNLIGSNTTLSGTPPYTSPATTVYTKGIYISGTTSLTVTGNTIQNMVSYVATPTNAIELNSQIGSGGVTISNNIISGVVCNTTSSAYGIIVSNCASNPSINANTISGIEAIGTGGFGTVAGISVTHTGTSSSVSNNNITNIKQRSTGGYPAYGINIAGGNAHSIINNSISDVNAPLNNFSALTTQYGPFGIRIAGGNNHKVYHNSVNLFGAFLTGSTTYASSSAFVITLNTLTGIDVRNNIFSNTLTGAPANSTVTAIMLPSGATSTMNLTLNNNAYYQGAGTGAAIAQVGTTAGSGVYLASNFNAGAITPASNLTSYTSTLSASGTNDNASFASSNSAPFVSGSDLHIDLLNSGLSALYQTGTSGTGVTNDFDNDTRATNPCIGADEFTLPACAGAPSIATNSISPSTAVCGSGTFVMSISPQTLASGYSYQWQSSSDNLTFTNVNNATNQNYSAIVNSTTYYQCILTCTASGQTATSTALTASINPLPTLTITPANNGYFCGTAGQTLTANGASTYSWAPAASLDASTGTIVTSSVSTPTTYTVTGTDANGCVNTQQITVGPPAISVSSSVPNFCGTGGNTTLTATSPIDPDLSYTWTALTPSATLSTSNGSTTIATLTETSDFKVTGTGSGAFTGCTSEAFVSIGVYPLPSATVTTTASGVCPGTAATINSGLSAGNFTNQSITHAPLAAPPTAVTLVNAGVATPAVNLGTDLDDGGWGNIPVGFNFNFFGTNYNTISIGTNGTVFFGAAPNVADFSFVTLPSATEPFNMIAVLAMDNNLTGVTGGAIKYWTSGYAPNRKFVVSYENVKEFGDTKFSTAQAIFYETTGVIEVHVTSSTNVDRNKLVGVNNGNGTVGVLAFASGTAATASNPIASPFAYRFTPPSNYTTIWSATDANSTTTIATGNNIFSQSVSPLITTTYAISYTNQTTGCTNAPGSAQVVMSVLGNTAPNEVVALTNTPTVCSGGAISLSTDYTGSQDGLTFQWQVSTDNGVTFNNILNATNLTYSGTQTQTSIYQLQTTACGGTPALSSPVTVSMTPYQNCYCTPTITNGCTDGDVIARVILNTLDNNSGTGCPSGVGGNGYSNYTSNPALTTTLLPSTTYNCIVFAGQYDANYAAWIDYNDDGIFDNNTERIGYTTTAVTGSGLVGVLGSSASFPVVLACTPPVGQHRLRIREVYGTSGINITPCGSATWGETEDYLITIAPVPTCPAPGQLSVVTTTNSTADLSWNLGCSSASNFDFEYGPVGFTQGTGTLVSNVAATVNAGVGTYTLTGLTPNSTYAIYYRANCGNGDVSPWSVATNGTTICNPITLNNPGNQTVCDSYTLPAITEATPSGNTGLVLQYRTQPNGGGTVITSSTITSSQTVYIYASAGSCTAEQSFVVTVNQTPIVAGGATNSTLCLGDSTNFGLTAGTSATFTFVENGNVIGTSTNPISFYVTPSSSTNIGVYSTANGCSSDTLNIALTVNLPSSSNETQTACDSYQWNGQTYTSSGVYTYTTQNAVGCDSVVTLNLTVNYSSFSTDVQTACDTYTWINGTTYTSSTNTPTFTLTNAAGCDSVITLNLTINYSSTGTDVQTACDTYTWIDGNTYTSSTNTPTFTITNAAGCDSTVTLNLTINNSSTGTDVQIACNSFTWIDGITYTSSTTTPTFTLTNADGCDSIVTLNLTINDNIADVIDVSECTSYTWNGQTYTQSGTYTYTGSGACSVTDTLNLTILNNSGIDVQTACETFTWIDGNTYTTSTNSPTFSLTNAAGCDSIVTLNLTINNSTTSSTSQASCGSYTWNGQTYTQSGTYTYTTSNANGCDSIATLVLTINAIPTATATGNGAVLTSSTGSTYQWIDCATNSPIQGATSQTFTATENGSYAVIVTNSSGCSDTSNCVAVQTIGTNELSKFDINVNPNPSTGVFNIDFVSPMETRLTVLDASGRIIYTMDMSNDTVLDLTSVVTGIYYLQLNSNEFKKVIRVVKN
jgi:hypothetical protein